MTLRCCGGVAGSEVELDPTNGASRVSGDMIIANEGESVCVARWPGAGVGDDDEEEDAVVVVASGSRGGGSAAGV